MTGKIGFDCDHLWDVRAATGATDGAFPRLAMHYAATTDHATTVHTTSSRILKQLNHPPCYSRLVSEPTSLSGTTEAPMSDLTQRLPVELLVEILGHASAPEILRSKQVKNPPLIYRGMN